MERRLYFLLGDLVSNAGVGALVGLAVAVLVGETWFPVLGMVVGMLAGAMVALPAAVVLSVPFGAMELMLPVMLTGMTSGMLLGMLAAIGATSTGSAASLGAVMGLVVLAATYVLNASIRARAETGSRLGASRRPAGKA